MNDFNDNEIINLLSDLKNLLRDSDSVYILIAGDLNCHFSRNTRFSTIVKEFLEEDLNMKIFFESPNESINPVDYTHMFVSENSTSLPTIDHFVGSQQVLNLTTEAGVTHFSDNLSNHSPIFIKLDVGLFSMSMESPNIIPRTSWKKASEEARISFKEDLAGKLRELQVPESVTCQDVHCAVHNHDIEDYTMAVLQAIESSAQTSLPSSPAGASKTRRGQPGGPSQVAGWKEHVKPYHEESKFWHSLWCSAGKPQVGPLFSTMKQAKLQFKYAYRRLKGVKNKLQNDKFINSIIKGGTNIFQEIKKFRGKSSNCSSRIDDQVGSTNIANHFATIYSNLYNQVSQEQEINDLRAELNSKISSANIADIHRIDISLVKIALRRMKGNKSDSLFDFQSDCLINGPPELAQHLVNMLRSFFTHGIVPYCILVCTLLPLVKDKLGDITQSSNYRAIAASSQILKLLDIVLLLLEGDKLGCDDLQFGFQEKSSTTMCTWAVSAVIDHYNSQGSAVYGCAMDLSKAFDMVSWVSLFKTLQVRAVLPIFLRVLLFVYTKQSCNVKWNGSDSEIFPVKNGVRQGAVSSPTLFSIYVNDLFKLLRQSKLGCRIQTNYFGCFGYADDLLLLSASRSGLQSMVKICENFAKSKNLQFSTNQDPKKSKTKCLVFSRQARDRQGILPILLNEDPLPWVENVMHLGNKLQCDNSMRQDIMMKKGKFVGKINSLAQEFHYASPEVFIKILNIYCTSFHGSSLWDLSSKDCQGLYKAWNVSMRLACNVPRTTHRYLIETISNCLHLQVMLASRLVRFLTALKDSNKIGIRFLTGISERDRRTVLGKNLSYIAEETGVTVAGLTANIVRRQMKYFRVPEEESWRVPVLHEIMNSQLVIPGFTQEETNCMKDFLCTS